MKRVELGMLVGIEKGSYSLTPKPLIIEFIYGTSAGGINALERAITDLELGRSKEMALAGEEIHPFFGCLKGQFEEQCPLPVTPEKLYLRFTLRQCDEVDPKDVVKAISMSLTGGCSSGSCGCGC